MEYYYYNITIGETGAGMAEDEKRSEAEAENNGPPRTYIYIYKFRTHRNQMKCPESPFHPVPLTFRLRS